MKSVLKSRRPISEGFISAQKKEHPVLLAPLASDDFEAVDLAQYTASLRDDVEKRQWAPLGNDPILHPKVAMHLDGIEGQDEVGSYAADY